MFISPFKRKILKICGYVLGSLVVLSVAFHFWFINHAEQLLEELVNSRSNGKLKLHIKKFKFNWFSYDMQLRNAVFYSADTSAATAYQFGVERIDVRVKEILPLIFEKKILIDSLILLNPDIQVTRLRSSKKTDTTIHKEVSLSHEMGKVYNSIQDALQILQVNRFRINNGKFTLINKIRTGQLPVTISHIYFHLDNLQVDTSSTAGKQKILFSDNVSLSTFNQDIFFPDGRHRLSFSNFHINILKKIIEFDSCTVFATKGDSSKSSFSVFFDKLQMTNIDFDTLYQKEVIKADSVYCINPIFKLDVDLEKRTGKKKAPPRLDELIQLLTGDMQLAFVVVNNGSFDINTTREGRLSSFTSDHNNFEMQGLRIEKNSPRPLTVESFAMAIRNYENFLRDSTYAMQFDSILFINNSVYLSNFSFKQLQNEKVINSFSMPQFELKGLSWDDLVFDRKLTAERATLYRPVINYSVLKNKRQNIFQTLENIGRIIELQNLDMSNGQINVHLRGGAVLKLENADMSLLSRDLVQSTRMSGVQRSIRQLRFRKASLKSKDITVEMENADLYGESGKLTAGSIRLMSKEKNLVINAKNVAIHSMMIDDNSHISAINGIQWKEADVTLKKILPGNSAPRGFTMTNINGSNTKLSVSVNDQTITTFLQTVSADKIVLTPKNKPQVINLHANGKNLSFNSKNAELAIGRFLLAEHQNSEMENVSFKSNTATDSVSVLLPAVSFTPDLNSIINGTIAADRVNLQHPIFTIRQFSQPDTKNTEEKKLPEVAIGKITIQQPEFILRQYGDKDTRIEWFGKTEKNNFFELNNFRIKKDPAPVISADQFEFALTDFSVTAGNKTFTTDKGSIHASLTGIHLEPEGDQWNWKGVITELQVKDLVSDNLGKNAGRLEIRSARLNDLALRSTSITNFRQTLKENKAFRLKEVTGQFDNINNHFDWQNLNYDKNSKILSVDSFTFRPTQDKESSIASHKYQSDYITLQTGMVNAGPFDIDRYLTDTLISVGTVNINNISMKTYRDKRKPAREGIIKPLPVNLIKRIPAYLSLDTVNLNNTDIEYSEVSEKTNQTATITINRMKAKIFPVNNYDLKQGDSLGLEAQAWLMDSVRLSLNLKESYMDSLAGFLLSASISPVDARILNPALIPLVSAKLESGFLDTLSMQVTGKEYVSVGEMKMYYHDLKIRLLKDGKEEERSFIKGVMNFLANSFIIKKSNRSRIGTVFFERLRNKSTLNYLVKITLSGISSSAGIKKSKKLLRRYKNK